MIIKKFFAYLTSLTNYISGVNAKRTYIPTLRLAEITKSEDDEYIVTIQVINKAIVFNIKPEEILAKDNLVDEFSPKDIRALTYLGYLGINSPKYKILAKRLSEDNDRIIFAIRKKGEKNIIVSTADEILSKKEIINNLNANDAQIIGYTVASENIISEKEMIKKANQQKTINEKDEDDPTISLPK